MSAFGSGGGGGFAGFGNFGGFGAASGTPSTPNSNPPATTASSNLFSTPAQAPSTGAAPAGGLFGNAGAGGGLFGGPKLPTTSLFGNSPAASSTPSTTAPSSFFGAAAPSSTASGGLFGSGASSAAPPTGGGMFGSGAPSTPATGAPAAFSFGKPATTVAPTGTTTPAGAPPAGGLGLFGGSGAGGGGLFSKPAAQPTTTASTTPAGPPPSNLFGGLGVKPAASGAGGLFGATAPSGSLFGAKKEETTTTSAAPAAPAAPTPAASGGLFGSAAPAASSAPAAPSAPAGGLFGVGFGQKKDDAKAVESSAEKKPALFGGFATKPAEASADKPKEAPPSLFGAKPTTTTAAAPPPSTTSAAQTVPAVTSTPLTGNVSTSTKPVPAPVPSMLRGKTLEDIVNKWSSELDERVKEFTALASEVRAWDAQLIQNGQDISDLFVALMSAEPVQATIDQALDYVEGQQNELGLILDSYEAQVDQLVGSEDTFGSAGGADAEREKAYVLADSLNTSLDDLSRNLSAMIDEVNSVSAALGAPGAAAARKSSTENEDDDRPSLPDDPISQISTVLNAHLGSLDWIEKSTEALKVQVADLSGKMADATASQGGVNVTAGYGRASTPGQAYGQGGFGSARRGMPLGSYGTPNGGAWGGGSLGPGTPRGTGSPSPLIGRKSLGGSAWR